MAWILLVTAGLFEVAMAYSLKMSSGFSHLWWSGTFLVFAVVSFALLSLSLKTLEVGTAYAVWTGIGAVGTAIVGMILLGDDASPMRIASIALIVTGVVGLNLAGGGAH
ncbi:multidrug efflux SMR transporter [Microbispora sp. NPDC046933]|uniref:DMT family transporter n=1 Tax=Microbispora sp. NPDC046933 TaxID=3155618 RepID=UPI0033CE2317